MKSYKIRKATFNNKRKIVEVETCKGKYTLPYSRLTPIVSNNNLIDDVYIDPELGGHCVTYKLRNGEEDSVPLDAFLDFNKDPEYIRSLELHRLTLAANKLVKDSGISKREICRRMNTSMAQLSRILDPANYSKTFDQLMKLLIIIGAEIKIDIKQAA